MMQISLTCINNQNRVSNLERFIKAQEGTYERAVEEVKHGKKTSHWMWFIFPQIKGLGSSPTSQFYAIKDLNEAEEYLMHPVLGNRLVTISNELLKLPGNNTTAIFGSPDDMKLKSSMTLFSLVKNSNPVFEKVLEKFFNGEKDRRTVEIIYKKKE
jgi:uncharacterized protein (DUF1810 family)